MVICVWFVLATPYRSQTMTQYYLARGSMASARSMWFQTSNNNGYNDHIILLTPLALILLVVFLFIYLFLREGARDYLKYINTRATSRRLYHILFTVIDHCQKVYDTYA